MIVFSASTMMKPLKKKLSTECQTTVQRMGGAVSTSFGVKLVPTMNET